MTIATKSLFDHASEHVSREKEETGLNITNVSRVSQEMLTYARSQNFSIKQKICCLIYGKDGRGKSGIALDYLSDDDIKNGKKVVIIDIDGGMTPLITTY